jgi:hypothetical protein
MRHKLEKVVTQQRLEVLIGTQGLAVAFFSGANLEFEGTPRFKGM